MEPLRKPGHAPRHARTQTHEIRVIGGEWKRTKIKVADKPGLRPAPDRVRETLFNWLGQDSTGWLHGRVCGHGRVALEADSRGGLKVRG